MKSFDAQATDAGLPFERLVPALREAFAQGGQVPPRQILELPAPAGPAMTSLLMPAWQVGGHYGVKVVNVAPGNAARGLPGVHAGYLLFDAVTGELLAQMDGSRLTARRTAAASALAASYLARAGACRLLVVGAGAVARLLPLAYQVVRPLQAVQVWARQPAQAEALARAWREEGVPASAVVDLPSAVAAADIVSCATLANAPLIRGAWLASGAHLDLIGSFTPAMREADDACLQGAGVWVDTAEALHKSGDLVGPIERGVFDPAAVRGTLESLCRGQAAGRRDEGERTVFKSVGTALEDLAAAGLLWRGAGSNKAA